MTTSSRASRAVIYTRVSSDRDGGGRSVGEQEAACRVEAERHGWSVARVLTDNSFSATRWARRDRPAYAELARVLASGQVDVLVSWEASRAQRDLTAYAALRDLSVEHGVSWSYSGRLYDMADDDDRFSTGVDALVSEREAGLTRARIVRSVEARAARGGAHGRLPDGYTVERDPVTGKVVQRVIDEPRAEIIREAARRLLAGESAWSVAAEFNARGLTSRTGKPWTGGNVIKRLSTPTLCGRRVFRGEVLADVVGDWPPILSEEDYDALQVMLADPRRKTTRGGPKARHQGSGVYRCGLCGGPLYTIARRRKGDAPRAYRCQRPKSSDGTGYCVTRLVEPVDARVDDVVVRFLSRPDVLAELADEDADTDAQAARAEVLRLRALLDDARAKVRTGAISLDDFAAFRSGWDADLAAAEERARPRSVPGAVLEVAGPDAAGRWAAASVDQRRAVLQALFEVRVMPTERRDGRFDPEAVVVSRRDR